MIEKSLLKRVLFDLKPAKKYLWLGAILYIPVTILSVIQPVIIGYAVQHGMLSGNIMTIAMVSFYFFLAISLLALCELLQGFSLQISGQILVKNLRQQAFDKVQRLSMGFLDSTPLGELLTRLTNDAESVVEMFSMGAVQILGDCLFLFGTFIMLFFVDVRLSLYSSLILPVLALGVYFFRLWTKRAFVRVRELLSSMNAYLQEYLSGIATVQVAGQLYQVHDDFRTHNHAYLMANRQAILLDAAIYSFVDAVSYITSALVLLGAFQLKLEHALSLGVLVAFLEALSRFFQPVRELSNRYAVFQSAIVSLERIYSLFDWPEEIDGKGVAISSFNEKIEFKHVNFSYKSDEPVLKDVSFVAKKGERLALIGPTGAGKSTVIKLLNRFYKTTDGEILIDGCNINEMSLRQLRRLISVVPQEVFLFNGNLRDNLSFGKKNASDEELWHALELTQLRGIIERRGGLKARVFVRGVNFSLGEKQLLAIARTIVTDPPILVMDEATASLDPVTERRLQIATKELLKNRTSIVIAHRMSTIIDADRILVFHQGQIIEQGNHQSLLQKDGMYAHLLHLQALKTQDKKPKEINW